VLAIGVDFAFAALQRLATPRGLRDVTDYTQLENVALGATSQ
jgi:hypothetical protein